MNINPLDRPVWHALNTQLAKFSEGDANARRFLRDVNLFAAAREDSNECLQALSSLVPDEGPVILLQRGNVPAVPNAKVAMAMAGERMKFDGDCEVSGLCTHPDARGRGFAWLLSRIVATRIQQRGETPCLHALSSNHGAIRHYEKLGSAKRCDMQAVALVK